MGVQIVMDRGGDTRREFDASDSASIALAEERFLELTGKGFPAAALGKDGGGEVTDSFDPTIEQTLFIPQLKAVDDQPPDGFVLSSDQRVRSTGTSGHGQLGARRTLPL